MLCLCQIKMGEAACADYHKSVRQVFLLYVILVCFVSVFVSFGSFAVIGPLKSVEVTVLKSTD